MSHHTEFTTVPPAAPASPPGHDPLAVWAFVMAWLVPLAGAIMGHVSNSRRKAAGLACDGLAVAAVVLGWVFTAISALAVILVVALAGLSSSVNTALTTPPAASSAPATPAQAPAPATKPAGALGTTDNVTDIDGNAYAVTAKQVIDPAQPASSYDTPDNGKHFVGVVFTVKVTSGKLDDAADNCALLMGSNGQSYDTTVSSIAGYDGTSTQLKLNAGEQQTVAVVFQVPDGVHPATVKWTPDSGMADSTATWSVTSTTAGAQAPSAQSVQAAPATGQDLRDIGGGVYAGSATSTAFAQNVVAAWKHDPTAGVKQVYSPVTGQTYAMTYQLVGAGTVIATGGNGAYVQF